MFGIHLTTATRIGIIIGKVWSIHFESSTSVSTLLEVLIQSLPV